jgi:chemotaxis regulatin CheY-phosphate phosphatase CheZ
MLDGVKVGASNLRWRRHSAPSARNRPVARAGSRVTSPDQQKLLSEEIQERVVSIFEACNFQDLTGQRIKKVMTTMKFIEKTVSNIGVCMEAKVRVVMVVLN